MKVKALPLQRVLAPLALILVTAFPAHALRITSFYEIATFDIGAMVIDFAGIEPPKQTEAITVEPGESTVWFTGSPKDSGKSYIYEAIANITTKVLTFVGRVETGFYDEDQGGNLAEGIAFLGRDTEKGLTRLLVTNAPDDPDEFGAFESGVYLFEFGAYGASGEVAPTTKTLLKRASNLEGLGLDLRLDPDPSQLWAVDERRDKLIPYDMDLSLLTLSGAGTASIGIDAPEGVEAFGGDVLVVDDGGHGPGKLVQLDSNGNPIPGEFLSTVDLNHFTPEGRLWDPQGAAYDPMRRLVYLIGDDDNRITVLTPEPGAALLFAAQALAVGVALRRRRILA